LQRDLLMFRAPKRTDYTSKGRMSDAWEPAFDPAVH